MEDRKRERDEGPSKVASTWLSPTIVVGVCVLFAFGVFVVFMTHRVGAPDSEWSRLVYVYGSVEAIVFAAAGAIFGTQIQRRQTQDAEARAKAAQDKADKKAEMAARGAALASAIRAERRIFGPEIGKLGSEDRTRSDIVSVMHRLFAIADELFPPANGGNREPA